VDSERFLEIGGNLKEGENATLTSSSRPLCSSNRLYLLVPPRKTANWGRP